MQIANSLFVLLLGSVGLLAQVATNSVFSKETWEKIAIAVLSAVLAFIGSYLLSQIQRRSQPRKQLSYDTDVRKGLVTVQEEVKEKVKVLYSGQEITDLYYVACNIENTGTTVIKKEQIRFEFPADANILDHFFDPKVQPEFGVEPVTNGGLNHFERKFAIAHLEKNQKVGFRFILTSGEMPQVKLHPFNDEGDVEFIPRAVSVVADERFHIRSFAALFIMFTVLPPIFSGIPFGLGTFVASIVQLAIFFSMLPHIKPFAKTITELIVRTPKRTVEAQLSIREARIERLDLQTESKDQ